MPSSNFYESSNGDVWSLAHDPDSGAASVMHQPNAECGGKVSYIDVDQFLRESPSGPQHQALKILMDTQSAGNSGAGSPSRHQNQRMMSNRQMPWTPNADALLRNLKREGGLTLKEIAARLGRAGAAADSFIRNQSDLDEKPRSYVGKQ